MERTALVEEWDAVNLIGQVSNAMESFLIDSVSDAAVVLAKLHSYGRGCAVTAQDDTARSGFALDHGEFLLGNADSGTAAGQLDFGAIERR